MNMVANTEDSGKAKGLPGFTGGPFQRILHPTDLSEEGYGAFLHAVKIGLAGSSSLHLIHVAENGLAKVESSFPSVRSVLLKWEELTANDPDAEVCDLGLSPRKSGVEGKLIPTVCRIAKTDSSDLLVLSTHDYRSRTLIYVGSRAEIMSRKARAATLFVPRASKGFVDPDSGTATLQRVLVPVSNRPDPSATLSLLGKFLNSLQVTDCEVRLLYVGCQEDFPRLRLLKGGGVNWLRTCRRGSLVPSIITSCRTWQPDLVVMTTSGHDSVRDTLFGSHTERVLHECGCPLLAFPVSERR